VQHVVGIRTMVMVGVPSDPMEHGGGGRRRRSTALQAAASTGSSIEWPTERS